MITNAVIGFAPFVHPGYAAHYAAVHERPCGQAKAERIYTVAWVKYLSIALLFAELSR